MGGARRRERGQNRRVGPAALRAHERRELRVQAALRVHVEQLPGLGRELRALIAS